MLVGRTGSADTVAVSGSGTPAGADIQFTPAQPRSDTVIRFTARTDGLRYSTPCYAAAGHGGVPRLSVDATRREVMVQFELPIPLLCAQVLVSGLRGSFGPLAPGTWTLVVQDYSRATFNVSAATTNAPPSLALRALASGREIEVCWTSAPGTFVLESRPTPGATAWAAATNAVLTNASGCVVTIPLKGETVFFRLKRSD